MRDVRLLQDLVADSADRHPTRPALLQKSDTLNFSELRDQIDRFARAICAAGLAADERVAIYLPKQFEVVISLFGTAAAGGVTVPVNPLLKPQQVAYILQNCNVRVLVTSGARAKQLAPVLDECRDLVTVVLTSAADDLPETVSTRFTSWQALMDTPPRPVHPRIDTDMAAILYTSGSTGLPKGVVLSHRNMVEAAKSSAEFLGLTADDRLLAVLPLSFDYGLSQLTTAYSAGGSVVLMDYLFPREVPKAIAKFAVTGVSAVPPIWNQLAVANWPDEARQSLRYITTSGGAARSTTLKRLRELLPNTRIFQMYGLTEAFRSSYLSPEEIDERPGSVGKALPNVELMVVREDGSRCAPDEPGELVHRGTLVAMGYWNDPQRTSDRFRPAPGQPPGIPIPEIAVWSGDQMRMDADGYLYFVSRKDEMIKTSGYRVSPTEVEEVVFASGFAAEAVALGVPHPDLGQAIILLVHPADGHDVDDATVRKFCQQELPTYMIPAHIQVTDDLPRSPNGKIDRAELTRMFHEYFSA